MVISEYIRDLVKILAECGDIEVVRAAGEHEFAEISDGPKVHHLRKVDERLTGNWVEEGFADLHAEKINKDQFLKRAAWRRVVL